MMNEEMMKQMSHSMGQGMGMMNHPVAKGAMIAATGVARSQGILTLEQAQQIARQNNAAIRLAESDLQIARNNTTRGNAGFLPKIDATAGFTGSVTNTNQEYRSGEIVNRNGATATNVEAARLPPNGV